MMLVDSHCHLDKLENPELALATARKQGVVHFLCIGVEKAHFQDVLTFAENNNDVSATIGVHPTEDHAISEKELFAVASHPKVIGIGETGLDYYRLEGESPDEQQEKFRMHIRVARELKKPLIVHTRMAREDTIKLLKEEKASDVGGIMHCFTEDWEMAKKALDLNFRISFSGIVTFKNALDLQEIATKVPLDKMLIETDCPWLAPMPYRGKANEPAYVYYVAKKIAELRNETIEKIAHETTHNFFNLFALKRSME